jgi:nitrate/nitrite transporter NarK
MKQVAAQFFATVVIVAVVVRYWWVIALAVAAVAVIVGMITAWRDYESSAERTAKRQAELRRRADQRQKRAGR